MSSQQQADIFFMRRALMLARLGRFRTAPNPCVGCVLTQPDSTQPFAARIIGEGFHQQAGQAHAEVNALADAKARGETTQGATAYVTLEPCAHFGKTPPCADALIRAGVARVVVAAVDDNPLVGGQGIARLQAAGIAVTVGVLSDESQAQNRGFFKRMRSGLPYVCLKMAMSLDARIATASGQSQWITSKAARDDVQQLRASCDAILTSSQTVLADNPRLTVRLSHRDGAPPRQPLRVILDREGKTLSDLSRAIFHNNAPVWLFHDEKMTLTKPLPAHIQTWQTPLLNGQLDLGFVLKTLGAQGVNQLLVEAGGVLAGVLLAGDWVDEYVVYIAPLLLGSTGRLAFSLALPDALSAAKKLQLLQQTVLGTDVKLVYQRHIA